jgi:hypothetical protein
MGAAAAPAEGDDDAHEDRLHQPQRRPSSYRGVMTEFFTVHGTWVHLSIVDDPKTLEEPMVRSNNFRRALGQHVGPAIRRDGGRIGRQAAGWVPHWPIGTRHTEFADRFGLPWEVTRGARPPAT